MIRDAEMDRCWERTGAGEFANHPCCLSIFAGRGLATVVWCLRKSLATCTTVGQLALFLMKSGIVNRVHSSLRVLCFLTWDFNLKLFHSIYKTFRYPLMMRHRVFPGRVTVNTYSVGI